MGGKCPSRKVKKRRFSHKTARRDKFELKGDDLVYDELKNGDLANKPLPRDEDLPGMGQYYCLHCDRYFANSTVRDEHFKTKRHRKRLKQMSGPAPHSQLDAELASGMGMPDNGPTLMAMYDEKRWIPKDGKPISNLTVGQGKPSAQLRQRRGQGSRGNHPTTRITVPAPPGQNNLVLLPFKAAEGLSVEGKTSSGKPNPNGDRTHVASASGIEDLFYLRLSNVVSPFSVHQQQFANLALQQSLLMAASANSASGIPNILFE